MLRFLLNLRLLVFLLRFLFIPAVAFLIGLLVFLSLLLIIYAFFIAKTLKLITSNPVLGTSLLIIELILLLLFLFLIRVLYVRLKERWIALRS